MKLSAMKRKEFTYVFLEECLPHEAEFVRELHAKVQANIEKRYRQYERQANQRHAKIGFRFVCEKKGFLLKENSSCNQEEIELFMVNDNDYKLDLSTTYDEEFDSRTNPFEEGGNDRDLTNKAKEYLRDTGGSLTRPKTNMMKQSLQDSSVEKNEKFDS
ncbi:hypothetical protein CR513_18841, partial [Mucuna pruriens]